MTAKELITQLEKLPPDMLIFFGIESPDAPAYPVCGVKRYSLEDTLYSNPKDHAEFIYHAYEAEPETVVACLSDSLSNDDLSDFTGEQVGDIYELDTEG